MYGKCWKIFHIYMDIHGASGYMFVTRQFISTRSWGGRVFSSPKRSSPKRGLFETMPKSNIARNAIAFNAAIHACKTAGQWQSALNLFKTITEAACWDWKRFFFQKMKLKLEMKNAPLVQIKGGNPLQFMWLFMGGYGFDCLLFFVFFAPKSRAEKTFFGTSSRFG